MVHPIRDIALLSKQVQLQLENLCYEGYHTWRDQALIGNLSK